MLRKAEGIQYAALPWRIRNNLIQVLLVTSRETRRWVIPKGWPMEGVAPHEAAAQEAFEEAGLIGEIDPEAVGCYPYDKRLKSGAIHPCTVEVFAIRAVALRRVWPEQTQRRRRWFSGAVAAARVDEPELSALIRAFCGVRPPRR